jgi:hypothetical protein
MMLTFYGLKLKSEETGEIERDEEKYKERYQNMLTHTHNHNRIRNDLMLKTNNSGRIIRSLGQMGFARYREPLVKYLQQEVKSGPLKDCQYSLEDLWLPALDVNSKE